jgi:hypothetical protein
MQNKGKGAKTAAKAGKAKSKASGPKAKSSPKAQKAQQRQERLRPGQLDGLVLGYMKKHKGDLPVSPSTVAHGIKRSSGAVGNCLSRLERAGRVRLVDRKPRRYDLTDSTK